MGILRVDHPDIEKFITCKNDTKRLTNFNISVGITDAFMEAVSEDRLFPLVNPRTGKEVKKIKARGPLRPHRPERLGHRRARHHLHGRDQPGQPRPPPRGGRRPPTPAASSPCCPTSPATWARSTWPRWPQDGAIDYAKLADLVHTAVHFLDNVIDANNFPLEQIKERTLETRKIGLGVMGFADLLLKLGIPYNSEEAVAVAEEVMAFIQTESRQASAATGRYAGQLSGL